MRGQHPGISQPMHRQQPGYDDLQSLQQHLMYKQLQEFQRQQQQQQQQLGQDQKQHLGISAMSKHAIANHLATPVNGVPTNDKSNYLWQNELAGGDHKLHNSSQMSIIGNMCSAQDNGATAMHGFSNGFLPLQDQALQLMGFVPQQSDQSFYGMPVSNPRGSSNHYSQVQGVSQDFSDVMIKNNVNQKQNFSLESTSYNSFQNSQDLYNDHSAHNSVLASNQDLHGKRILSHEADSVNRNIAGDVPQVNSIERASQGHEFNVGHGSSEWTGNLQRKGPSQPSSSQASVGLDPTEQRILFSSDDDWASFGGSSIMNMSGLHGSHLEGNDLINAFPPIQSGSWSALMQSAVAEASSSDMGLQDEWSGLTFQKVESSSGNHDAMLNDNVRQQNSWLSNNNASILPSRTPSFGKVDQPRASNSNTERNHFNAHAMDDSWDQQQNTPPYRFPSQPNDKENNWNMDSLHSSSIEPSFRVPGSESAMHHDHSNDPIRCGTTYRDQTAAMWNTEGNQVSVSSPPTTGSEALKSVNCFSQGQQTVAHHSHSSKRFHEINMQELYQKGLGGGKFAALGSSNSQGIEKSGSNHQIQSKSPQLWESSLGNLDKLSGDIYDRKHEYGSHRELSNESYMSTHSHPDHSSDSVGGARENHHLSASNSHSLASVNKKHSQVGNEMLTSKRFHHGSMGNVMQGSEIKDLQQTAHTHNLAHMITRGSKVRDQRYMHESVPSNHLDPKMRHANYLQINEQGTAEISAKGDMNGQECKESVSFDESATLFLQSNQSGQASQHILELLRRVDESTEKNKDSSDGNILSKRNITLVSDSFNEQSQQNKNSALHGFGLRLSLPSEQLSGSSSVLSSHTSPVAIENHNSQDHGLEVEDKRRVWPTSTISKQSVAMSHQVFRPHDWNTSVASGELTESNMQIGNDYIAGNSGDTMYRRNQLNKQQQISGASGSTIINHSGNPLFGAPYDTDKYSANSQQQKNNSHVGVPVTSQPFAPDSSGRAPPFALSSADNNSHVISQSSQLNMQGQSHPMMSDSLYKRIPTQQLHTPDAGQVSQHSLASLVPQIGGTVGSSHNLWTDISNQYSSDSMFQQSINSAKHNAFFLNSDNTGNDDQKDGESKLPNFSGYSGIAQNLPCPHETPGISMQHKAHGKLDNTLQMTSSQGLELLPTQASDGSSSILKSSQIRGQQQDKEKQGIASPYSLLQQVQAMKAFETNPSIRSAKRFKGTERGSDSEQSIGKPSQNIHGYNIIGKSSADSELNAVVHHNSFSSDSRMLSFSSEGVDQQNTYKPQGVCQELSRDMGSCRHDDSQNYPGSASMTPNQLSSGAHKHNIQINPQMASTWFQQYGNLTNGSVPAVFGGFQKSVQITDKHYFTSNVSESVTAHNVLSIGNDAVQVRLDLESASTSTSANQLSSCQALSSVVLEPKPGTPKKRKSATSELLPWHKEITLGSERLQNIRMAERNWAQATNRLLEKVDNENGLSDDRHPLFKTRRRLVLTSQLMQLLLPAVPAVIFTQPASMAYGNVTYLVAKWGLGDACNLLCCSGKVAHGHSDGENMLPGKTEDREGSAVHLKLLENFFGRARKLETDLNRFEKRASVLDVRVECQELEKFSIINRFAKFHGRSQADGVESSMTTVTSRNMFVQRNVTAIPMLGNAPDGVVCLSL